MHNERRQIHIPPEVPFLFKEVIVLKSTKIVTYHYAYNIADKPLQIYSMDRRLLNNQPFYQRQTSERYL